MNPTNKVQTRVSAEEGWQKEERLASFQSYEAGWNAALDSVILPAPLSEGSGKRFEVGDRARWGGDLGKIIFKPDDPQVATVSDPRLIDFPLPQTVELTDDEKLNAVEKAMAAKSEDSRISVVRDLAKQLTTKTLGQLCAEYCVPTKREM